MSGIAKGVKKVFKAVKKVVKKIWKPLLIATAVAFTGGLAAGGFAAFQGVSSVGGFLGAVGSTTMAGVGAIGGTLGLGTNVGTFTGGASGVFGATATSAGYAGATLGNGALGQWLGASAPAATTVGAPVQSATQGIGAKAIGGATQSAVPTATGGSLLGKAAGWAAANPVPAMMGGQMLMNTWAGYQQNKADEEELDAMTAYGYRHDGKNDPELQAQIRERASWAPEERTSRPVLPQYVPNRYYAPGAV